MPATSQINIVLEIVGSVLSIIIIICLAISDTRKTKPNRAFSAVLYCNIIALLSDAACWAVMGNPETNAIIVNHVATFIVYVVDYIMLAAFAGYLVAYIQTKTEVSRKFMDVVYGLTAFGVLFVIISQFNDLFYYIDENNIYHRTEWYVFIPLFAIVCMFITGAIIIYYRKKLSRLDISFLSTFIIFPVLAIVLQFKFYGLALIYVSTTLSALIIYLGIQSEQSKRLKEQELELVESRIAIMLSQIKPHFLYNSLVAIEQLCDISPKQAKEATSAFSRYLRANLDSLNQKTPIPFEKELEHVRTYLLLEKMRFEERLSVVYEIKTQEFMIPTLTLQLLVENAVRHGICKRQGGGTVTIRSEEMAFEWRVTVTDDGVGFDEKHPKQDGRSHVGIENVCNRLYSMCGGSLQIKSAPGEGTSATISIPKTAWEKEI